MNPCYHPAMEGQNMGRFEVLALKVAALPIDRQDAIADFIATTFVDDLKPQSLLSEAQLEELGLILSQPIEYASDEEMSEIFED
jgi:hypothetical protein